MRSLSKTPNISVNNQATPNQNGQSGNSRNINAQEELNAGLQIIIGVGLFAMVVVIVVFAILSNKKRLGEEWKKIGDMSPAERAAYAEQLNRSRKASEAIAVAKAAKIAPRPPPKLVEYRRTCQVCGKVWHSLPSREKQIVSNVKNDSLMACGGGMQQCGTCGTVGGGTAAQASRNLDANQSELQRLKSCPECHSVNYKEDVVEYEK